MQRRIDQNISTVDYNLVIEARLRRMAKPYIDAYVAIGFDRVAGFLLGEYLVVIYDLVTERCAAERDHPQKIRLDRWVGSDLENLFFVNVKKHVI